MLLFLPQVTELKNAKKKKKKKQFLPPLPWQRRPCWILTALTIVRFCSDKNQMKAQCKQILVL